MQTGDIPFDASPGLVETKLQELSNIGLVTVQRSQATSPSAQYQNGYIWTVTFTSDDNAGNIPPVTVNVAGLTQTNPSGGSATGPVCAAGCTDGNELSGTFDLTYTRGALANAVTGINAGTATITGIPFDATPSQMKAKLEDGTIIPSGSLAVSRSSADFEKGYTWTVTFLEDYLETHRGDVTEFVKVRD